MDCRLIVLLVRPAELMAGCGAPGRRFEWQDRRCFRPLHVIVVEGAVADVYWAAEVRRLARKVLWRCGEMQGVAGGQVAEMLPGTAVGSNVPGIAKAAQRDA